MPERRKPKSVSDNLVREDLPPCRYYLSTGSTLLDLAISGRCPGGVGSGRITQIYGDESTAKTLLLQEILGSAQRAGGSVVFEDAEHTLDFSRAGKLFGLDTGPWADEALQAEHVDEIAAPDAKGRRKHTGKFAKAAAVHPRFTYRVPATVEDLWDWEIGPAIDALAAGDLQAPCAMGIDSLSALPSASEVAGKLEDPTYGQSRAKGYSAGFRKYVHPMAQHHLTVVAIDQTRVNVGKLFGDKATTSGGMAMQFYASTRIKLSHAGSIKNKHEIVQGVKIKFKIVKNKLAPPFREGLLHVLFDYGIDDLTANLEWLLDKGKGMKCLFGKSGATYTWDDVRLSIGLEGAVEAIEKNGTEAAVRAEVVRIWDLLHAAPQRKLKER